MDLILILIGLGVLYLVALIGYRVGRDSALRSTSGQVAELRTAAHHYKRERDRYAQELADLRTYLKGSTRD